MIDFFFYFVCNPFFHLRPDSLFLVVFYVFISISMDDYYFDG